MFWKYGKKWRLNFEKELQFRKIGNRERNLLVCTGWIVFLLYFIVFELEEKDVLYALDIYIIFVINLTVFILTITITLLLRNLDIISTIEHYQEGMSVSFIQMIHYQPTAFSFQKTLTLTSLSLELSSSYRKKPIHF